MAMIMFFCIEVNDYHKLNATSVIPTPQFCACGLLLLVIVGT
jgi:hypothetical protein